MFDNAGKAVIVLSNFIILCRQDYCERNLFTKLWISSDIFPTPK
jgi:hypothetical protein